MKQDERAPFDRALRRARLSAHPLGEFVSQEGFMRASEILALAVEARGRRQWPADSAARTGNPAARRPATERRWLGGYGLVEDRKTLVDAGVIDADA
jgi:hypothetical protein